MSSKVNILGVKVDKVTIDEASDKIMEYIKSEKQTFITTTSLFNIPDELLKEAKIIKL